MGSNASSDMRAGAGNLGGIILRGANALSELERTPPVAGLGPIGRPAAVSAELLHQRLVGALAILLTTLRQLNGVVSSCAEDNQAANGSTMWDTVAPGVLASRAAADGSGASDDPGAVVSVLTHLATAGFGEPGAAGIGDAAQLDDWLSGQPDNQARLSLVEVHAGTSHHLDEVPGGVRPGDVVVLRPPAAPASVGIVGTDGRIYNRGLVGQPAGAARVSVYRPAGH
ncbi:WXG100 family type VII secretion target [Amycolatopsis suaedae]|uniref:WXG100 family type VII secretion target n=1 Tax=Amycolatopsis suaedae TaxID=2510978 RepID=A0A4Q7IZ81_9PSEU|nr:WXG100 family type VII secretion target [Amycolatopsis suaedae]RZQ59383.1 WXG100 family type VII secretion target [Amycolatopsis suaedae]